MMMIVFLHMRIFLMIEGTVLVVLGERSRLHVVEDLVTISAFSNGI